MARTKTELNSQRRDWLDRLDPRGRHHKQPITVGVRQLDRDEANDWLLRVDEHHQRNLALTRAILYATDMTAGDWIEGAQLIAFDLKGRLTNGQHVLTGFVRSELKKLLVIWVILRDPRAYMAFDHNRKRTARDTLRWHGIERPGEMQSIATALFQYEHGHFADMKYQSARAKFPSDAQVQHTIKMHPGLEKHLWKNPFKGKEISVGGLNAASYILYCISPTRAEKFYESLIEGINLPSRDHPVAGSGGPAAGRSRSGRLGDVRS